MTRDEIIAILDNCIHHYNTKMKEMTGPYTKPVPLSEDETKLFKYKELDLGVRLSTKTKELLLSMGETPTLFDRFDVDVQVFENFAEDI
jgi:hypothetical protein